MMEYMIATSEGLGPANRIISFAKRVNQYIKVGWKPLGGCATFENKTIIQAMIREEEVEDL